MIEVRLNFKKEIFVRRVNYNNGLKPMPLIAKKRKKRKKDKKGHRLNNWRSLSVRSAERERESKTEENRGKKETKEERKEKFIGKKLFRANDELDQLCVAATNKYSNLLFILSEQFSKLSRLFIVMWVFICVI